MRQQTATADLGEWMLSNPLSRILLGEPPHATPGIDDERPGGEATLYPVWGDEEHSVLVAVEDYDGCQAIVQRFDRP